MAHSFSLSYARALDGNDALSRYREQFHAPKWEGKTAIYFLGNSLGLQPKAAKQEIMHIMDSWGNLGVEAFFTGNTPWLDYPRLITPMLCPIVGAKEHEIVIMNQLTVNLHFLMVSFYRPTPSRFKIICEARAFPSDQYAMASQVRLHGYDPATAIIEVVPAHGAELLTMADIQHSIDMHGDSVALVLFGAVNYYTGQAFNLEAITAAAHKVGAYAGFDLAHAAGNIPLSLHDDGVDFAAWCNYKYLNSGPGAIAGAFIHERYHHNDQLPRLQGWWGNAASNRFRMDQAFTSPGTAEGWSNSTTPMLLLAAHKASLDIFADAGFDAVMDKARALSDYLIFSLDHINRPHELFTVITPAGSAERGCQVSISVHRSARAIFDQLLPLGIFADWREPNVIRVAPVPLYNSFEEIFIFANALRQLLTAENV